MMMALTDAKDNKRAAAAGSEGEQAMRRRRPRKGGGGGQKPQHSTTEDEGKSVEGVAAGTRGRRGKFSQAKALDAMPILVKAACSLFQGQREVEAVVFDVLLVPTQLALVAKMKEATLDWSKQVKAQGKGHVCGPPHLRAWEALRDCLLEADVGMANKAELAKFKQAELTWPPAIRASKIRSCRLRRAYDPEKHKLALAFVGLETATLRDTVSLSLQQLGAEAKSGLAPPSALERQLQNLLDQR